MKFNSFNQTKKSQRGISLFDFVLWIAIAGVFIGLIYSIFGPSRSQVGAQAVGTEVQLAQTSIHNMFRNDPDMYKTLTAKKIFEAGVLPTTISIQGTTYVSREGGPIDFQCSTDGIKAVPCDDTSKQKFAITYSKIPVAACNLMRGNLNASDWASTGTCELDGSKAFAKITLVSL